MPSDPAEQIRRSWEINAEAWSRVVAEGAIPSRAAGTDAAILAAVISRSPRRVLDLGCGEGWLARKLAESGLDVVGVDASAELIRIATGLGGARYFNRSYDDVVADPSALGRFDAVVANFALLHEDIVPLLRALRSCLRTDGVLLVQTVHPWISKGSAAYRDEWRTETFSGFGEDFSAAMPWYFRTLGSWVAALGEGGFRILEMQEPTDADGQPLSLLMVAAAG